MVKKLFIGLRVFLSDQKPFKASRLSAAFPQAIVHSLFFKSVSLNFVTTSLQSVYGTGNENSDDYKHDVTKAKEVEIVQCTQQKRWC